MLLPTPNHKQHTTTAWKRAVIASIAPGLVMFAFKRVALGFKRIASLRVGAIASAVGVTIYLPLFENPQLSFPEQFSLSRFALFCIAIPQVTTLFSGIRMGISQKSLVNLVRLPALHFWLIFAFVPLGAVTAVTLYLPYLVILKNIS